MKKENTPIVVTSIIAASVVFIALLGILVISPITTTSRDVVTVQGTSTISVIPDRVSVYFNIQTNGSTSAEANDANTEIYNDLVDALLNLGFERSEIGTQNFNVYPNYEYDENGRTQNGYVAVHSVKIELPANQTSRLTSAVDGGIDAGAGISYINFELSPSLQSEYKAQALGLASQDARVKAEAVAEGFDKSIGRLVSVSVDNYNYYPWVAYAAEDSLASGAMAKTAASSITPTEQDITAMVSATYKIK